MQRIILVYGALAGAILVTLFQLAIALGAHGGLLGMALGYLSMIVALSLVFVGVRKYRDEHLGGVIRFGRAFAVGLGISGIAAVFYVLGWEAYMWATDYSFAAEYTKTALAQQQAAGASAAELARMRAELDAFATMYADPLVRMAFTLSEIAPVALLVPLISAGLLRNPRFMPARA